MFEWEEVLKQQLVSLISTVQWKKGDSDGWIWEGGHQNIYTVHLGYKVLGAFQSLPKYKWLKE